jgi:Fe2+ transport system protein FeoA
MTTLAELPSGARALVAGLPLQHALARRLIALGLTPGAEVCVLQNRGRGPLIVEAHGARIALGRRQADRVTIDLGLVPCEIQEAGAGAAETDEAVAAVPVEAGSVTSGRSS